MLVTNVLMVMGGFASRPLGVGLLDTLFGMVLKRGSMVGQDDLGEEIHRCLHVTNGTSLLFLPAARCLSLISSMQTLWTQLNTEHTKCSVQAWWIVSTQ